MSAPKHIVGCLSMMRTGSSALTAALRAASKEIELGWLAGRSKVVIPIVNDGQSRAYPEAYRSFVATFRAPAPWVDAFYDTEVARHFYSLDERTAFRIRWSHSAHDAN